jgi:GTP:adenosylcobinamide-phosphate guanylyltransferase
MAGKPMAQWVLDALSGSEKIEHVVIVGLEENCGLTCTKPMAYIPNQGGMLDNIRAGIDKATEINPATEYALIVSSDIPAITPEMVNWSINQAMETDDDIYYSAITREVMDARFPGANRTFLRFKDVAVCGGDMNVVRTSAAYGRDEFWNKTIEARKNVFKQAALLGYDTLFLLLFRRLTINGLIKKVASKLGLKDRALICPYAEVAMDVDKPYQLEMLRADLAKKNK